LAASPLIVMRLVQSVKHIDALFHKILSLHSSIRSGDLIPFDDFSGDDSKFCGGPTLLHSYKFESEALVFHIRHCLDTLCRLTELLTDGDRVNENKQFRCDSIGVLFGTQKSSQVANIVRGLSSDLEGDETEYLSISNDLFNAMKHTHMNSETQNLFCLEIPFVTAFHAPDGEHGNQISYHNHNAYHLMMGFHDTIDRIIRNQLAYLATK
jgi:hypothetical protein